jgi:23S rRNA (pseudouridine1915-N3)-methyltransferase
MKIIIGAVGRLKAGPEREIAARYQERFDGLGRGHALGPLTTVEIDESRARRPDDRKADEAARLLAAIGPATLIALDESGKGLTSEAFAYRIGALRDGGTAALAFLIGGADGHGEAARRASTITLAFGPMTLPHQIVRLILAEQLYRAATILAGHPYHRV